MSTRQARFEIARTSAGWHSRYVAANGRTVWTTESYERRGSAENAIRSFARTFWAAAVLTYRLGHQMVVVDRAPGAPGVLIRDVDDRYVPPPVELRLPIYRTTIRPIVHKGGRLVQKDPETLWHDREYHWRQCTGTVDQGGDCTEEIPPVGTQVRSRVGHAEFTTAHAAEAAQEATP